MAKGPTMSSLSWIPIARESGSTRCYFSIVSEHSIVSFIVLGKPNGKNGAFGTGNAAQFGPPTVAVGKVRMDYHLYFLDPAEHINSILKFDCSNDEIAVAIAQQRADSRPYELWSRDRLVVRHWLATVE